MYALFRLSCPDRYTKTDWLLLQMQHCESKCTHVNCQMACRESTAFLVPKRERSYALQVFQLERRLVSSIS